MKETDSFSTRTFESVNIKLEFSAEFKAGIRLDSIEKLLEQDIWLGVSRDAKEIEAG